MKPITLPISLLLLTLFFIVPMGPLGLEGLSQLTGLEVTKDYYDFRPEQITLHAQGKKDGQVWEIFGVWQVGQPQLIVLYDRRLET